MKISLIIPVYNAAEHLDDCLSAATTQDCPEYEVIVVDDCSTDDSLDLAKRYPVRVVQLPENAGASAARNAGVKAAASDFLVFIDSDVVLPPDGLARLKKSHDLRPDMSIIVGAYSENTAHLNFVSDYKNLDLVFRGEASAEYKKYAASYCISIHKDKYLQAGGFDENLKGATAEDIDFGLRVCRGERLVYNDRSIKVDHLKRYTLYSMLRTNFHRLVNMSRIRHAGEVKLQVSSNSSIEPIFNLFLPMGMLLLLGAWLLGFASLWASFCVSVFFLGLNASFFHYIRGRRGSWFMLKGIVILFVEYLHAFVSLCVGFLLFPPPGISKKLRR